MRQLDTSNNHDSLATFGKPRESTCRRFARTVPVRVPSSIGGDSTTSVCSSGVLGRFKFEYVESTRRQLSTGSAETINTIPYVQLDQEWSTRYRRGAYKLHLILDSSELRWDVCVFSGELTCSIPIVAHRTRAVTSAAVMTR